MMESYQATHGSWDVIPFDSEDRNGLKQNLGICAMSEARTLGLAEGGKRKFGIPMLVLVDCESGEIQSWEGVNDLVSGDAFQKWGLHH